MIRIPPGWYPWGVQSSQSKSAIDARAWSAGQVWSPPGWRKLRARSGGRSRRAENQGGDSTANIGQRRSRPGLVEWNTFEPYWIRCQK